MRKMDEPDISDKTLYPAKDGGSCFQEEEAKEAGKVVYIGMCTCMYNVGYNRLAKSLMTPALDDVRMLIVDQV